MSNKKERKNQKEISTKCFLGTTEKCGPFEKICYHKPYTTKYLIKTATFIPAIVICNFNGHHVVPP